MIMVSLTKNISLLLQERIEMKHTKMDAAALSQLQKYHSWYFMLGISLIFLGTLAVIFSFTSTLISVIYLGIFITIFGIFEGAKALSSKHLGSFFLHTALSVLYIIGGLYIVLRPASSAVSLTLFLAFFFILSGVLRIFFSQSQKNLPHKNWLLINGILTFILGILVWYQWPYSGLWVIGTFVGIDALITGWTWVMLSLSIKKFNIR